MKNSRFVGTVTDISFFDAVDSLIGYTVQDRIDMINNIRDGATYFFPLLFVLARWQQIRFYSDEYKTKN